MKILTEITYFIFSPTTRKPLSYNHDQHRKRSYLTSAVSRSNFYRRTRRICKAKFNLKSRFMCHAAAALFLRRNCSSFLNYVSRSALAVLRFAFIKSLVRFQVKIYCRETRGGRRRKGTERGRKLRRCSLRHLILYGSCEEPPRLSALFIFSRDTLRCGDQPTKKKLIRSRASSD